MKGPEDDELKWARLADSSLNTLEAFVAEFEGKCIWTDEQRCFAPGGWNGPHGALETPVRNTSHWLVAILILQSLRPRPQRDRLIAGLRNWLVQDNTYFVGGTYVQRQKAGCDGSNGVIGNAWVVEALSRLSRYQRDQVARKVAEQIIDAQRFNVKAGLWARPEPGKKAGRLDFVLDHQAWFASTVVEVGQKKDVVRFLDCCRDGTFSVHHDGRIHHVAKVPTLKGRLVRALFESRRHQRRVAVESMERAYHHYTLFPFARLIGVFPEHELFRTKSFLSALRYFDQLDVNDLIGNKYAFEYNAPGFEFPLLTWRFRNSLRKKPFEITDVVDRQNEITFSTSSAYCVKAPDTLTLTARVYELALFLEAWSEESSSAEKIRDVRSQQFGARATLS